MDYGYLREKKRRFHVPLLEILSFLMLIGAIGGAIYELIQYNTIKDTLPVGDQTIGGVSMTGLDSNVARQRRLEQVFVDQPVYLLYDSSLIELIPSQIRFEIDSDAMLAAPKPNFWRGFWNYLWNRPNTSGQAKHLPLSAHYDENRLRDVLADIAGRYDAQVGQSGYDPVSLTFENSASGKQLDVDQAVRLIDTALHQPNAEDRRVTLPLIDVAPSGEPDGPTLEEAIRGLIGSRDFANNPDRLASVYVMDLQTGNVVSILADVAHSATSTIKIPIMLTVFRSNATAPSPEVAYWLTESLLCSNNDSSNFLVESTGSGSDKKTMISDGLNNVSCTVQGLGAEHTYMDAPIDVGDPALHFVAPVCMPDTPANTTYNTNPDAYAQTTAQDMGLLLTEMYDCAYHGGGLMAIYPDDYTQTECQQMIEVLSGNRIDRLIELGVPLGTRVAHKNGWSAETSADAGIVFTPGGDYVLAVYIWEKDADGNGVPTIASWELVEEISRLVYNYFNPDAPLRQSRQPIHPYTAIDCVTVMSPDLVDLNDINKNRLDENGNPLPTACYGGAANFNRQTGQCKPFDGW